MSFTVLPKPPIPSSANAFRSEHRELPGVGYFVGDERRAGAAELAATADRISALKAASLSFSPSRMSMARRVFPSRLELNNFLGSWSEAPRKKVSFTTCLYDSPVQTPPS